MGKRVPVKAKSNHGSGDRNVVPSLCLGGGDQYHNTQQSISAGQIKSLPKLFMSLKKQENI